MYKLIGAGLQKDSWSQFKLLEDGDSSKQPLQLFKVIKSWTRSIVVEMEKAH